MTDDLDDLETMLTPSAVAVVPAPEVELVTAAQFIDELERLLPFAKALIAGFAGNRIRMEDPAERAALVRLRALSLEIGSAFGLVTSTVERVFLAAAIDANAEVVPLPGGARVRFEKAKGDYVVQARPLRVELLRIGALDGAPTVSEVDAAIKEVTTLKPNHTHLNSLSKSYGGPVKAAIDKYRQWVQPPPERGRVRFPELTMEETP